MQSLPIFNPRNVFIISLLAACGALGAALIAQFGYGLKPCILCLYARIPYVFLIIAASAALLMKDKYTKQFLIAIGVGFFAAFCVAFFHIGVEQHWWELAGGCPVEKLDAKSSQEMLAQLLATPLAPCDKVGWRLFGMSIVIWNAVFSLLMHDYVLLAYVFNIKKK
jgi:disulfide bond formation protein DsbB